MNIFIFWDKKAPVKLKVNICQTVIKPAMLNVAEC